MSDYPGNISARLKAARATDAAPMVSADQPTDHYESYKIRARMVGVLLRDARIKAQRTVEECAGLLRITADQYERWEYGDEVPSLPQLELLAYFLDVPISHFWSVDTLEASAQDPARTQIDYLGLRDRMIGALLRIAREERGLSLEALSDETGVAVAQIESYEMGAIPVPMHELTVLSNPLRKSMTYFLESSSHLGELLMLREEWKHFTGLPEDIRKFAANPLNVGFIEIAILFSQMPADSLRRVGESVLNISL
ncbi:MAG: helix-turn-helix transcriptional regulator [Chloroflexota bacterium]|nr:helix-turn-helix transcriptional regulator [Chloroflexota bacterium]